MITILILASYLLLAIIPAVLPFSALLALRRSFPGLAFLPLGATVVALVLAQPLTNALGYAVAVVPLAISFVSLATGVVGMRFAIHAHRDGSVITKLVVLTTLAFVPFLLLAGSLVSAILATLARLTGSLGDSPSSRIF